MRHLSTSGYSSHYEKLPNLHKVRKFVFIYLLDRWCGELTFPFTGQRPKRPRAHSPPLLSSTPLAPALAGSARGSTTPAQRGSAGPQPPTPSLRETKTRRDTLSRQLPLQEGRMVAFHPPSSGKAADGTTPEDTTWIMARIVKSHQDKYRYVFNDRCIIISMCRCLTWHIVMTWKT
jgi:hypothetical protein